MGPHSTSPDHHPWLSLNSVEAWIQDKRVFKDLSLDLWSGEPTVVLGPNGSGKSSLVRLISRALYPVVRPGSHLRIFGEETINLWELRRQLGIVNSDLDSRIHPSTQGRELLLSAFFGAVRLGREPIPTPLQNQRVELLLKEMDLDAQGRQPYGSLSDGQKRRLQIARALVHEPEVLVLDEPMNTLDLKARHSLQKTLRKLCRQGITLVMVTHSIESIIPEIERVIGLRDGQVVMDDTPKRALTDQALSELFDTPLQVVEANGYRQVLPG